MDGYSHLKKPTRINANVKVSNAAALMSGAFAGVSFKETVQEGVLVAA